MLSRRWVPSKTRFAPGAEKRPARVETDDDDFGGIDDVDDEDGCAYNASEGAGPEIGAATAGHDNHISGVLQPMVEDEMVEEGGEEPGEQDENRGMELDEYDVAEQYADEVDILAEDDDDNSEGV